VTWDLRLGSCLDPIDGLASLADKSVDVTVTDPPYEDEAHTLQRRQKGMVTVEGSEEYREVNDAALTFAPITADERIESARQIARVTRHAALVFCQVEAVTAWRDAFDSTEFAYRRCIPWLKPDAMPSLHGRWPGQSFESIVLATRRRGARPCPLGGTSRVYTFTRAQGAAMSQRKGAKNAAPHPTTKPLRLMRAIVEDFTLPGDLVLDGFAGSGTTGIACNQLGRRFIGWELDAGYYEIARRRLSGDEARPSIHQPGLFDMFAATAAGKQESK